MQGPPPGGPVVEEAEYAPPPAPPPPPPPLIWPWLLLLLLLVIGGLLAWFFLSRDNDHGKKSPRAAVVPNVVGLKQDPAVRRINGAGLTARLISRASGFPRGTVFAEAPGAGARVARRSVVTLSVSAVATTKVPNVVGLRTPVAVRRVGRAGLRTQVTAVVSRRPSGVVIAQSPGPDQSVAKGSTVALRVSKGLVTVPDVVAQDRASAASALRGAGLVPRIVSVPSPQPKGTVTAQRPAAGARVPRGSTVRINVSTGAGGATTAGTTTAPAGPTRVKVPNVVGLDQTTAQRRLRARNLRPSVVYVSSSKPAGRVVSQRPTAGTTVRTGSRVQINVSTGPNPAPLKQVPNVIGQDEQTATTTLEDAGFTVESLPLDTSDPSQDGIVIDEQPRPGSRIPRGSQVTIYVGRFTG